MLRADRRLRPVPPGPATEKAAHMTEPHPNPQHGLEPIRSEKPHGRRTLIWASVAAAAVVVAVGAVVGVAYADSHSARTGSRAAAGGEAQGGGPNGPRTRGGPGGPGGAVTGDITSIDGSTITVSNGDGSAVTVTTTSQTVVSDTVAGSPADVAVGDTVAVLGNVSGTTVSAERIVVGDAGAPGSGPAGQGQGQGPGGAQGRRPGGAQGPMVRGSVVSEGAGTFTVDAGDGTTYTVQTSDATSVTVRKTLSLADLAVGDTVRVFGRTGPDATVTAAAISVGNPGFGPPGSGPGGGGFPGGAQSS